MAVQCAGIRCVNDLLQDNVNVLPEKEVDNYIEDEPQGKVIDDEGAITEKRSILHPYRVERLTKTYVVGFTKRSINMIRTD